MTRTGQHQRCISAIHWLEASGTLALGAMFVTALIGTPAAQAQTYTVLHKFKGAPTDGRYPEYGHLIGDSAGNLYGTTYSGGASGYGAVFKLDPAGTETILYSFTGEADGGFPNAVIRDSAGNLYGTAGSGGAWNSGAVFKLDPAGTETVLYSFTGRADGAKPLAGLIRDSAGNLYGTASAGGVSEYTGVVFKLDTAGTETVLHTFTGGADGGDPEAGLIRDSAGDLYGTTSGGGVSHEGVVFKLDATGETVLYSFTGGADGSQPVGGLLRDSAGNLYGTTPYGGASGNGVVFKLDTTGTETVLYSFTGGADGSQPEAGLIQDPEGNLYGTTYYGGAPENGVVFELDTTGTETVLYSFAGGADGSNPYAGLIRDSAGNLYGTARFGGISGSGVVFRIQP